MLSWLLKFFSGKSGGSGLRGEQLAADWLRRERGFAVVARNWRSPYDRRDEIDLVCRDGEVLVFVEVKTRDAAALVPGIYSVNARKKRVLRRAVEAYLAGLRQKPGAYRLDVVEVAIAKAEEGARPASPAVLHFENVGLFSRRRKG